MSAGAAFLTLGKSAAVGRRDYVEGTAANLGEGSNGISELSHFLTCNSFAYGQVSSRNISLSVTSDCFCNP